MDADTWRRICTNDLCDTLASGARRLAIIHSHSKPIIISCRLIPLDKKPGVHPIGIREVFRRILGKATLYLLRDDIQEAAGSCAGHECWIFTLWGPFSTMRQKVFCWLTQRMCSIVWTGKYTFGTFNTSVPPRLQLSSTPIGNLGALSLEEKWFQSLQPHGWIRNITHLKQFIRTTDLAVSSTESAVPPSMPIFVRNSQDFYDRRCNKCYLTNQTCISNRI